METRKLIGSKDIQVAFQRQVPVSQEGEWSLETTETVKVLTKKELDKNDNFWLKRGHCVHDGITRVFKCISRWGENYPDWFAEGNTSLFLRQVKTDA